MVGCESSSCLRAVLAERMGLLGHDWGWGGNRGLEGVLCRRGSWEEMKVMGREWVGRVMMNWCDGLEGCGSNRCFEHFVISTIRSSVEELRCLIVTEW